MSVLIASRRLIPAAIVALLAAPLLLFAIRPKDANDQGSHPHGPGLRRVDPETSCGPVSLAVVSEYLGQPGTIGRRTPGNSGFVR